MFCILLHICTYTSTTTSTSQKIYPFFCSCLNPIIYGFMSRSFRKSFVSELKLCCCGNESCCCCFAGSNNYHENNSSAKEKFRENQGNCSVQFNGGGGGVRGGSISVMATRGESTTRGRNKSMSINSFKGGSRNDQGRTPFQTVTWVNKCECCF